MTETAPDLDRLRGGAPPRNHDARTIAALTANPGCARRGVMDAAGIDKDTVAQHLGFPSPFGQSQFAITRGNAFEAQVKADGCAELLTLLRDQLGLAVAAAARQSAVYVLALRRLTAELGYDPGRVSHEVFLVCPENFSNRPTATPLDVRPQLAVLERQLARLTRVDTILQALPEDLCFELGDALADSVRAVEARYAPECMAGCEMAFFCRDEARACGATGTLGRSVRNDLGGIDTIGTALALANGSLSPSDDLAETAAQLRAAARLRDEVLAAARGGVA